MKAWLFPICNVGFKTTLRLFADYKVEGRENIPARGPAIFVANHLSNLDPPIVAAVSGRRPGFLAKEELFKLWPFAFLLRAYGAHPIDRRNVDRAGMKWALSRLKEPDGALVLFPEGTRDKVRAGMKSGLPGVAQLASLSGAPIVPMGITGSEPLQKPWHTVVPATKLRVTIGPAFRLSLSGNKSTLRNDLRVATDEIMVRVARLVPESYRGYYRDRMDMPMVHTLDLDHGATVMAEAQA